LERWFVDPDSWNVERDGPTPDTFPNRVPMECHMRFKMRLEKRRAQEAEDAALLENLLTAAHGNYDRDGRLLDLRPIHVILNSGVSVEDIIDTIKCKVDRRSYPSQALLLNLSAPLYRCDLIESKPLMPHDHPVPNTFMVAILGSP